jgi:hypothetical protein
MVEKPEMRLAVLGMGATDDIPDFAQASLGENTLASI